VEEDSENYILASEDLGEAGESLFKNLCARAKLNCIKSDRDRSGWDFIVDFPLSDEGSPETLDQRQKVTCHVQLKTTAVSGNGTVSLKLSAADLLAKDSHPALIAIFRLNKNGEPLRGYLIHLLDESLSRLLRRLRRAEAQGRRDTHNLKISFDYRRDGSPFALTPAGLKAALMEACGSNPAGYAMEKVRQLNELGYEEGQFAAEAVFQVEDEKHFSRLLLGLDPIKPIEFQAFDIRFGIAVPYKGQLFNAIAEIFLSPPSVRGCSVVVSGPPLTPAASFDAQIILAHPVDGRFRMLVKHPYFQFIFQETLDQIEVSCTFEMVKSPLTDLANVLRALDYLALNEGMINISSGVGEWGPLQLSVGTGLSGPNLHALPRLARFVADWKMLLDLAGTRSTAMIDWDDLWDDRAHLATDLMLSHAPIARFKFDVEDLPVDGQPIKAIYLNRASVAGEAILYSVEITLAPDPSNSQLYRSVAFRPIEARAATIELDDYMDDLVNRFKPPVVLHPDNIERVPLEQVD
jgi:hypothetical protein